MCDKCTIVCEASKTHLMMDDDIQLTKRFGLFVCIVAGWMRTKAGNIKNIISIKVIKKFLKED